MLNAKDIMQTQDMIANQHLDIRTITMGISLLDCADPSQPAACRKIYDKICRRAEKPPMKFTPHALAAISRVFAMGT